MVRFSNFFFNCALRINTIAHITMFAPAVIQMAILYIFLYLLLLLL